MRTVTTSSLIPSEDQGRLFCIQSVILCFNNIQIQFAILPTAVQTFLGGSPHRGRIAAPTVPYDDLPLVRLMYEYSWYEVPYWYEYLLPACMQGGRQAGMQASRTNPERISNESQTNPERIPNAPRPTMRAPVSTCSAVQYRTTCREADRKAGIPNESRTNPKRISNVSRTHPVRQ